MYNFIKIVTLNLKIETGLSFEVDELSSKDAKIVHGYIKSFYFILFYFSFGYSDISKFIMFNKTKSFPKFTPTSCNTDKILLFTLYGKLRVSSKKGINKICKGNVFFYKYVHIIIRLQMKKNVFFLYIKTNNV